MKSNYAAIPKLDVNWIILHCLQYFIEIYRMENFDMVKIDDKNLHGKFFGGDSYVIRYSYQNKEGRDAYIVYFWQVGNQL